MLFDFGVDAEVSASVVVMSVVGASCVLIVVALVVAFFDGWWLGSALNFSLASVVRFVGWRTVSALHFRWLVCKFDFVVIRRQVHEYGAIVVISVATAFQRLPEYAFK